MPSQPAASSRRGWIIGLGAVLVAAGVVVAAVLLTRGDTDDKVTTADTTEITLPADVVTSDPNTTDPVTDPAVGPSTDPAATEPPSTAPTVLVPTPSELARSVVQIQLLLGDQLVCSGSGTIYEADGTILTNSHVIAQDEVCPHDRIGIAVLDVPELAPQLLFEADVLVDDPTVDLAIIRIARRVDGQPIQADFPTVAIGDSDVVQLGDELDVVGYPAIGGDTITFTVGTISGFVTVPGIGDRSWFKTDATLAGGNSGGLAADDQGRIVGIPTIVGAGQGRITDCRAVADTNSDGQIDQNDACVPVGGFINGIRPINVALPLMEAARTATPTAPTAPMVDQPVDVVRPDVSNAQWSLDADGTQPAVAVPAGSTQLCVSWQYTSVPTGSPFEVTWAIDNVVVPEAGAVGNTTGAADDAFFACISNDVALPLGLYEMSWFVNGDQVFSEANVIADGATQVQLDVVNQTTSDVCIAQFSPVGAVTFGLNRLSEPVPAGATASLAVSTGSYDVRVLDCDGLTLIEDTSGGVVITGDSTYTLTPG